MNWRWKDGVDPLIVFLSVGVFQLLSLPFLAETPWITLPAVVAGAAVGYVIVWFRYRRAG